MAIQTPQFRPAASPVAMTGAAAPSFSAPQPVQAPRAPAPIMLQSAMPTPAAAADNSFIDALNAFGNSLGRVGAILQARYQEETKEAAQSAEVAMASMTTEEAISYTEKVKLEDKNRALVDGTMTAFGSILASRLTTDPMLAQMSAAQAAEYVRGKTKEYSERFNHEAFNKTFGPAAADLVTKFDHQKLVDENKAYKQQYIDSITARAQELRPHTLKLPEDQQVALVQKYLDEVGDKVAADGTLDKSDLNAVYLNIAKVMAQAGDELGVKAVVTKKRGSNPALIEFSDDAQQLLRIAQERRHKLNEVHIAEVVMGLEEDAKYGRLNSNRHWKQGIDVLVKEFGLSGEKLSSLREINRDVGRSAAYIRDNDYVQGILTDVDNGVTKNLPTISDPRARAIWTPQEIEGLWARANVARANLANKRSDQAMAEYTRAETIRLADELSERSGAAWTALSDVEIARPDGKRVTIKADDIKDQALARAFERIDNDPTFQNDPNAASSAKVGVMISGNHIPSQVASAIKLGADTTTAAAIVEQDPAQAQKAFSAQLQGLGFFREFARQGGLAALRSKIGDDAVSFYNNVSTVATLYGLDDVAAVKYLASARNVDKEIIQTGINKLHLSDMKEKIASNAIAPIAAASESIIPFAGNDFIDGSFVSTQVLKLSESSIRSGIGAEIAVDAATRLVANSYTSYKGLIVPRSADMAFVDVQDYFMDKLKEANPVAFKANGEMALVPLVSTGEVGQSGVHILRSTETGAHVAGMKPVTFTNRNGTTFTINDPNHIGVKDLLRIRDAMQADIERGAYVKRQAHISAAAADLEITRSLMTAPRP